MSHIVDFLLLAVLTLFAVCGWRRGFARSVYGVGRLIGAIAITAGFGSVFSAFLDARFLYPRIRPAVYARLSTLAEGVGGRADALLEAMPSYLREHIAFDGTDATLSLDATVDSWSNTAAAGLSGAIAAVIGRILLFVAAFFLLTLLGRLLRRVVRFGPLATLDSVLGLILGLFGGVAVVLLGMMLLPSLLTAFGHSDWVASSWLLGLFGQ